MTSTSTGVFVTPSTETVTARTAPLVFVEITGLVVEVVVLVLETVVFGFEVAVLGLEVVVVGIVVEVEPVVAVRSLFAKFRIFRFASASEIDAVSSVAPATKSEAPPHACTENASTINPANRFLRLIFLENKTASSSILDTLAVRREMEQDVAPDRLCIGCEQIDFWLPDERSASRVKRRKMDSETSLVHMRPIYAY
jgi:hypothetical protein